MGNVYSQHILDPSTQEWAVITSGSGGSYNDLLDQPIRNAVGGTAEAFVNLAGLEVGHYSLTGFYKVDSAHGVTMANAVLDVIVCYDEVTSKKTIVYPSVADGDYYINKITYDGITAETIEKLPIGGGTDWGEFN